MAKIDPKAKAKRQKIIAGVLCLVLVGVLIFQAPTIMGIFGGGSSETAQPAPATPPAPAPTTPAPATPGTPTPTGPVAAGGPGGSASLVDSDPAPIPADGQLVSFDRFESKDPFAPQINDRPTSAAAAPSVPGGSSPQGETPQPQGAAQPSPAAGATPAAGGGAEPSARKATIAVNGTANEVAVGASFPQGDPIFRLTSLKNGVARVGIVRGGYANGTPTISLTKRGKPVTLMNTADGTTYVLRYVR